jgi:alkanesulfonate monooxygenase SsuD/methylene tetrahydromethanopterin reductase-like flavin-dependent oxidoreductase (luciferase family)
VFLGAVSQRTRRIRIGHGVVLLPPAYNQPVRTAERIATLDILSNGRVDFGTGRSGTPTELDGFGIDPALSKEMWDEALRLIPRMWSDEAFACSGRFFSMPARPVVPKPVQKPHPPMWVAASTPETFVQAGERGLGVLCFILGQPDALAERIAAYRAAIKRAEPAGAFVHEQVAGFSLTLCLDDAQEAQEVGGPAALWYMGSLHSLFEPWRGRTVAGYEYYPELERRATERAGSSLAELLNDGTFCIGDPQQCVATIRRYAEAGVDQLICLMQAGRIPHEKIVRSIELFAEKVMPAFR